MSTNYFTRLKEELRKDCTIFFPILFMFFQILTGFSYLLPVTTPIQFLDLGFIEFLFQGAFLKPLEEEFFYRTIVIGFFGSYFSRYLGKEKGSLVNDVKKTVDLSINGNRYPHFQDTDKLTFSFESSLIILSAFIFGVIHIWGYGITKFISTFLAGITLGALYLRYGVLSSLIFHMVHNTLLIFLHFYYPNTNTLLVYLALLPLILFVISFLFERLRSELFVN